MLAMAVLTTSAVPARPAISQEPGAREDTTLAEDRIAEGDRIRFAAESGSRLRRSFPT